MIYNILIKFKNYFKFFFPLFIYNIAKKNLELLLINSPIKFLKSLFFKQKIKYINNNLILISQIQRSGGTLLSQLFDNHHQIFSYPSELILNDKKKFIWQKNHLIFSTLKTNNHLIDCFKNRNYSKKGSAKSINISNNAFFFNNFIEKKIFKKNEKKNLNNDLRLKFNAYFTAFFNAFTNYKNTNNKKKYIVAFLPRFINYKKNISLFFKIYPTGYIISVIRPPETWLASAIKHTKSYKNISNALKWWIKCFDNSINLKKIYNKRIILIKFDDLIKQPEKTLKKICSIIKIKFNKQLLKPTFNGKYLFSDSSFQPSFGKIDKNTVIRKIILSKRKQRILKKYIKYYNKNKSKIK